MSEYVFFSLAAIFGPGIFVLYFRHSRFVFYIIQSAFILYLLPSTLEIFKEAAKVFYKDGGAWPGIFLFVAGIFSSLFLVVAILSMIVVAIASKVRAASDKKQKEASRYRVPW